MQSHEIDYEIMGDDIQIIEVELDPGEVCNCRGRRYELYGRRNNLRSKGWATELKPIILLWVSFSAQVSVCLQANPSL